MRIAPSKWKVLLQDWMIAVPNVILRWRETNHCRSFHLPQQLPDWQWQDGGRGDYVYIQCSRGVRCTEAFVGATRYFIEVERSNLLYRSTLSLITRQILRAEDVHRLKVSDYWCLCCIVSIGWSDRLSNMEFGNGVVGIGWGIILSHPIQLSRLRWLGHVLPITNIECAALFSVPLQGALRGPHITR